MPRDAASQVLSGLLSGGTGLIDEVQRRLSEDHFTDPTLRSLYRLILSYRSMAGGVLTSEAVEQFLAKSDSGTAAVIQETFDALKLQPVPADATRWQVQQLRDERELFLTRTAMREASDILTGSITEEPDRFGRPGRTWSGAADSREWLAARISEIASETQIVESPAADVLREGRDILQDYVKARDEDKSRRPHTGIPTFDLLTGGLGKGELITVAAASGYGKTQFCVSLAYYASQMQGLNVYFATSETVRATVRARLVARHSRHEKFAEIRDELNVPHGLDSQKIDRGTLRDENPELERFLGMVAMDWGAAGESASDGSCYVAQMPHGQTMPGLRSQIDVRARVAVPDLIIIDYLALMSSARHHASTREELSAIIKDAAHFAVDFNRGEGVPVISPWQLNRESQKEMLRTGELDQNGLAETAEAVNSSDLVLALSSDGSARNGRLAGLKLNVLKNRDGLVLLGEAGIPLSVDYAASWFEERLGADGGADPFGSPNGALTEDAVAGLIGGF